MFPNKRSIKVLLSVEEGRVDMLFPPFVLFSLLFNKVGPEGMAPPWIWTTPLHRSHVGTVAVAAGGFFRCHTGSYGFGVDYPYIKIWPLAWSYYSFLQIHYRLSLI